MHGEINWFHRQCSMIESSVRTGNDSKIAFWKHLTIPKHQVVTLKNIDYFFLNSQKLQSAKSGFANTLDLSISKWFNLQSNIIDSEMKGVTTLIILLRLRMKNNAFLGDIGTSTTVPQCATKGSILGTMLVKPGISGFTWLTELETEWSAIGMTMVFSV